MGFNSGVLDLKLPEREQRVLPEGVKKQINEIVKKKENYSGWFGEVWGSNDKHIHIIGGSGTIGQG